MWWIVSGEMQWNFPDRPELPGRSDKICTGITFLLFDQQLQQTLPFHLKAQVEECFIILWKEVKRPRHDTKTMLRQQASKTAWKILSDWTEIQCSMILLGQVKLLQMFLPFMYDVQSNETFFDKISNGKMKQLPGWPLLGSSGNHRNGKPSNGQQK